MNPKKKPQRRAIGKPSEEARPRRILTGGAILALIGIALVGTGEGSDIGTALCIFGVGGLIYAIHTFGRLGPPTDTEPRAEQR
jgi:hypothetical protein